jgi:hypothetical protein
MPFPKVSRQQENPGTANPKARSRDQRAHNSSVSPVLSTYYNSRIFSVFRNLLSLLFVKLVEYISGSAARIVYMDCGQNKCDLAPFLREIERSRPQEHNQLVARMDRTAKYGVVWNNYKTKRLQGKHAQPICEFCSAGESRIFWFFDENDNKLIICTHGFVARGKHDHRSEIVRAQQRRSLYYEHKRSLHAGSHPKKLGP